MRGGVVVCGWIELREVVDLVVQSRASKLGKYYVSDRYRYRYRYPSPS